MPALLAGDPATLTAAEKIIHAASGRQNWILEQKRANLTNWYGAQFCQKSLYFHRID
jgi:hypothetical protein